MLSHLGAGQCPSRARAPFSNLYKGSIRASYGPDGASENQGRGHMSVIRANVKGDQTLPEVNDDS